MAAIDAAKVAKVASLASLNLTPAEAAFAEEHLGRILAYAADLDRVVGAAAASSQATTSLAPTERADVVVASLPAAAAVANAARCSGSSFQVPRIIES